VTGKKPGKHYLNSSTIEIGLLSYSLFARRVAKLYAVIRASSFLSNLSPITYHRSLFTLSPDVPPSPVFHSALGACSRKLSEFDVRC